MIKIDIVKLFEMFNTPVFIFGFIVPLAFFFLVRWWIIQEWNIIGSPHNEAFDTRIKFLENSSIYEGYINKLNKLLLFFEKIFGRLETPPKKSFFEKNFNCQPFTSESFERAIFIAFLYPLIFMMINWLFFNKGEIGSLILFKSAEPFKRIFFFLVIILCGILTFNIKSETKHSRLYPVLLFFGSVVVVGGGVVVVGVVGVVVVVGVVGVVGVVSVVGGGVVVVGGVVGVVGVVVVGVVGGILVTSVIGVISYYNDCFNKKKASLFWIIFWCVLFLYLNGLLFLLQRYPAENITEAYIVILFLGLLPLLNAPLDWISIGITRGFLHRISLGKDKIPDILIRSCFDFILALFFLICVGFANFMGIYIVNKFSLYGGGGVIVDTKELLNQLKTGGIKENLWIWGMVGSTLVPTFLHFLCGCYGLFVVCFKGQRIKNHVESLRNARKESIRRREKDTSHKESEVAVDSDAMRYAFLHLISARGGAFVSWIGITGLISYIIFTKALPFLIGFL